MCGSCFNSLLNLLQYYFCFMFDFLAVRLEILAPQLVIIPPSLEGKVLTAGLPGKSLWLYLMLLFQWRWSGCSLLSQSRRLPTSGLHHRVAFSSLWTCLQSFSWIPTGVHSGNPAGRCKLLSCLPLLGICTLIKALTWPFSIHYHFSQVFTPVSTVIPLFSMLCSAKSVPVSLPFLEISGSLWIPLRFSLKI